jgi:hypothetical protein
MTRQLKESTAEDVGKQSLLIQKSASNFGKIRLGSLREAMARPFHRALVGSIILPYSAAALTSLNRHEIADGAPGPTNLDDLHRDVSMLCVLCGISITSSLSCRT